MMEGLGVMGFNTSDVSGLLGTTPEEEVGVLKWLLATAFLSSCAWFKFTFDRWQDRIPGPLSIPLLGSPALISTNILTALSSLRNKYGNIYKVKIGSNDVVVLNGLGTVKRALVDQGTAFAGRPPLFSFKLASEGKSMVFNSYDERWKIHRRLAEKALKLANKESGFLDETVEEEFSTLLEKLGKAGGQPVDPESDIMWAVARAKYRLCYGGVGEENFEDMVKSTLNLIGCHNRGSVLNFFPWLRGVLFPIRRQIESLCERILTLTQTEEARHLNTYQPGKIRDCLDALIALGVKQPCPLEKDRVMHTVQEYLGAGLDIVYITMYWATLLMSANPQAQANVQREIDELRHRKQRRPTVADMSDMNYTHACVHEIFRLSCTVPFSLPHATITDTVLDNVKIPRDTFVLVNLHSINNDPDVWQHPDDFRPERFLLGGKLNKEKIELYNTFGMGRRKCVGEQIAKGEVFLFLVRVLGQFNIDRPPGVTEYDVRPQPGVILRPASYSACFNTR